MLSSSPPIGGTCATNNAISHQPTFGHLGLSSPFGCRRVASYPIPKLHQSNFAGSHAGLSSMPLLPSALRVRSVSESTRLHETGNVIVEQLRLQYSSIGSDTKPMNIMAPTQNNHSQTASASAGQSPPGTPPMRSEHDLLKAHLASLLINTPPITPDFSKTYHIYSKHNRPDVTKPFANQLRLKHESDTSGVQINDVDEENRCSSPATVDLPPSSSQSSTVTFTCSDHESSPVSSTSSLSAKGGRAKKKLSFADDHGLSLTQVRVMTEDSSEPPKIRSGLLRSLLGDEEDMEAQPASSWVIDFSQPASDYVTFRKLFAEQNVCLENVVLKNEQCKMTGTIRVANLAFEKVVFIRYTLDQWGTYYDKQAKYQPGCGNDLFDTFTFEIDLPCNDPKHTAIEFCVCYNNTYWDSNQGKNYKIVSASLRAELDRLKAEGHSEQFIGSHPKVDAMEASPVNDVFSQDFSNWAEFRSWKNLTNDNPYW